jgi:hypothetical protein
MTKARDLANLGNKTSLDEINDAYDAGALSNRNLIINGAMRIAQRGTSSTALGYYTLDRFLHGRSGGTRTFSQQTLASGTPFDLGFKNYMSMTNTTAGSTNTTDYVEVYHKIEAQDVATSGWNYKSSDSYITISFWVRSSVAGTYTWWMRDEDATSYTYAFNYTLASNTWTKVTHSIPGHSGLVFNNDNGAGLRIQWMAYYGSNYCSASATLNEWSTGASLPIHDTTWNTTSGATFDITGIQLEVGDTATPFEHRSYGDELAKCQRYYYELDSVSANGSYTSLILTRYTDASNNYSAVVRHPTVMRTGPTISFQSGMRAHFPTVTIVAGTFSAGGATPTSAGIVCNPSSNNAAHRLVYIDGDGTNTRKIYFEAEL